MVHKPVLLKEILQYLDPKPNDNFIDATVGQLGHTLAILEKNKPAGRVLGIDLDCHQIEWAKSAARKYKTRVRLVNDSYIYLKEIAERENFYPVKGILLDLGMSSWHLEGSGRGFSFNKDEVLDMRYDRQNVLTAEAIVNEYSQEEIGRILKDYGSEKFARQIARKIIEQRKIKRIKSTFDLKKIIGRVLSARFGHNRIHFATRTFQALRIAVNGEVDNVRKVLPQALGVLPKGGRLAVISFHSLEDRVVKNFFKEKEKEKIIKILTKKPVTASQNELANNPRARSAKLRVAIKI